MKTHFRSFIDNIYNDEIAQFTLSIKNISMVIYHGRKTFNIKNESSVLYKNEQPADPF